MKVLVYPHAGSYNHGCEAILRTTTAFIKENQIDCISGDCNSDNVFIKDDCGINFLSDDSFPNASLNSMVGLKNRIKAKILKKDIDDLMLYSRYKYFKHYDLALSIGGDNYCYSGMIYVLKELCKVMDHYRIPRILWGCSLDEKLLTNEVLDELKGYKAIFVRESVSAEILNACGIAENVYLYPDPAFTLDKTDTQFSINNFGKNGIIGLNLSPLMARFMAIEKLQKNYVNLVNYILDNTDKSIALIPHVNNENGNSDYDFMKETFKGYSSDRILLIDKNYNCKQLKSLISQCEVFVGCRTHATIAAYSTCVPTLVVGYSNKSKGIAKDIFGDSEHYIISGNTLESESDLTRAFVKLYNNKTKIKEHLTSFMPVYIEKSFEGGRKLDQIIKNI